MLRPQNLVITTNTTTPAYPLDRYVNGYAVAVTYSNATQTATWAMQQSFLDPNLDANGNPYSNSYKVSGQWLPVVGMVGATTASAAVLLPIPRAIRLITSNVSGGSVTFSIVPYGMDAE